MGELADQYNEDHFGERIEEEEQAADKQAAEEAKWIRRTGTRTKAKMMWKIKAMMMPRMRRLGRKLEAL
ncbi:hypothetical protein LTR56_006398 [Elasticomyces elasticus]|nr:hypothetical protein LTR56_006398 [Elasticomyces elasticus]KAK3662019.1 hypothetical protein LTR22_007190 [Elasticomyces elasticus]KAK4933186.1 hypothetical protein LTR49_000670 [Elasticomyces elasticus]KAK5756816.1 hypothetical protein LTS12_013017 [Elasticomyces elasticus]